MTLDEEWLATCREDALEPDLRIIDAHHHMFWERPFPYRAEHLLADVNAGHNIVATVLVEAEKALYRRSGPAALRSLGETEYANGAAAVGASVERAAICAGIVAHVDLDLADVRPVLGAHLATAGTRLRGVRVHAYRDETGIMSHRPPEGFLLRADFQAGFKTLAEYGLACDVVCFHPQLGDVAKLAESFPETKIVLNHLGGPLGVGPYADKADRVLADWLGGMRRLVATENVFIKVGGIANRYTRGISFRADGTAPSSDQLAAALKPYVSPILDLFGPERCMLESNFPIEKLTCSYVNLWNAFKKLTAGFSAAERSSLFSATAARTYSLSL